MKRWIFDLKRALALVFLTGLLLVACAPKTAISTSTPTNEPIEEVITETQAPSVISPAPSTPTVTLLPVSQSGTSQAQAGLILFAMSDGAYKHLFVYHPSYLPITRLTDGAWDDESPAVSPDGNQVAFLSNRGGKWDIFILDLRSNTLSQVTDSPEYEGSFGWSPDGRYLVYSVYLSDHFDLFIQSLANLEEPLYQVTNGGSNNFQPSWSPDGSRIAFVTDRGGNNEIWIAQVPNLQDPFTKIAGEPGVEFSHPAWSPDGSSLAWARSETSYEIQVFQPGAPEVPPRTLGYGAEPVWTPDGSGVLAALTLPNHNEWIAYSVIDKHLILPPIKVSGTLFGYDWKAGYLSDNAINYLSTNQIAQPEPLWTESWTVAPDETGRIGLVEISGVNAPEAWLSDAADESFSSMRGLVNEKIGWDFLSTLTDAAMSLTATAQPQIIPNWFFTGRAIALNLAPYEADYLVASREDFAGEVYWRLWVKCKQQDGTCGQPITTPVWDFNSRFTGEIAAYENGGKTTPAPDGFWVDFTELALRFGWERLPALHQWRNYFPAAQFNTFVFKQGLSWQEALLEIYSIEAVELLLEKYQ